MNNKNRMKQYVVDEIDSHTQKLSDIFALQSSCNSNMSDSTLFDATITKAKIDLLHDIYIKIVELEGDL